MPQRILYLVQGLGTGGLERVVLHLAREMVRRGHAVTVCCYDRRGELADEAELAGAAVETLLRGPGLDLRYLWRLTKWLRKQRPDVLHMHNSTALFYGTIAGRLARICCLIYTEHDGVFPRSVWVRWANRRLVRRLTHAVAVSDAVKRLWCSSDGVDPALVKVVPNGVPAHARSPGAEARHRGSPIRIGTVSRLSYEKGMDVLIEAFVLVHKQLPETELVLIGDGAERRKLEDAVGRHGLGNCVMFLGTRDDVPALLETVDIFVLPSRSEGLPLALLEAMAAGLPIVATGVGGVPEAIADGETGLLVPPEAVGAMSDAIIRLGRNTDLRRSLGRAAADVFSKRYEFSRMADSYESLMG